jgi:hypothetical protein
MTRTTSDIDTMLVISIRNIRRTSHQPPMKSKTNGAGTANNSGAPEFVFGFLRNVLWIIVWF